MLLKSAAVAATACTLIAATSPPVQAAGPTAQVISVAGPGCAAGVFLMRVRFDGIDPAAPVAVHTIVRSGGLVYMDESVPLQVNMPDTLWRLFDGATVESVLMRYPGRVTMCVSSQADTNIFFSVPTDGQH